MNKRQRLRLNPKDFFRGIGRSCYDMLYYRDVRTKPVGDSMTYVTGLIALLTLVATVLVLPLAISTLDGLRSHLYEQVPDGTSFALSDGVFSTTLPPATELGGERFTVVIDTEVKGSDVPKAFEGRVGFFVGADTLFYQDAVDQRTYELSSLPNFSVDKEGLLSWLVTRGPWIIGASLALFGIAHFFASFLGALLFVALASMAVYLASSLWGVRMRFATWFAVGLHAITLPTIIDTLGPSLGFDLPFAYPVVFFMTMFSVAMDEKSDPTSASIVVADGAISDGSTDSLDDDLSGKQPK